jgi:hypothetical protein
VTVVARVGDLMDRSRITAAVPGVRFVRDLADVEADVVLVDLGAPGALDQVAAARAAGVARVVGFVAHVDEELAAAARAAGCEVLPRSTFFRRLPDL